MKELLIGALAAALALVFVLWPLVTTNSARTSVRKTPKPPAHDAAIRALREIEFDRATGKLSDADYEGMKADYTARALTELRSADAVAAVTASSDPAEAMINAARRAIVTCAHCSSVCAEPDAVYCATCGHYLPGKCGKCGVTIDEKGARFCTSCGWELAA